VTTELKEKSFENSKFKNIYSIFPRHLSERKLDRSKSLVSMAMLVNDFVFNLLFSVLKSKTLKNNSKHKILFKTQKQFSLLYHAITLFSNQK
jgi:hypothetical protein